MVVIMIMIMIARCALLLALLLSQPLEQARVFNPESVHATSQFLDFIRADRAEEKEEGWEEEGNSHS